MRKLTRAHAPKHGFTLIELSIVIVIIGLFVGGVMMGSDLIWAGKVRATFSQLDSYKIATSTFKSKFNCLPGDCRTATNFFPAGGCPNGDDDPSTTCNGNGNGFVAVATASSFWGDSNIESTLYWQHLALAGMISGSFVQPAGAAATYRADVHFPSSKSRGVIGVANFHPYVGGANPDGRYIFPANYNHVFLLGEPWNGLSSRIPLNPGFTAAEARLIDNKFDDGKPSFGKIMSFGVGGTSIGTCVTSNNPQTTVYNTAATEVIRCLLIIASAF